MANWSDLASYIRSRYDVTDDAGDFMKLVFDLGDGRSQVIFVAATNKPEGDFAVISSPFARVGSVDAIDVLREVGGHSIGGVVVMGDRFFLRHTVPLADLDIDEFTGPFQTVLTVADSLEQRYMGSDEF